MADAEQVEVSPQFVPQRLIDKGGDQRTESMAEAAHEADAAAAERLEAEINRALAERGERVSPSRDNLREELDRIFDAIDKERRQAKARRVAWLEKRREVERKKLPELTAGPDDPAEDDIRRYVREAEGEADRAERIEQVLDDGGEAALRALFRKSVPAAVAGFRDPEHRSRKLHETLRSIDREALEGVEAISQEVDRIMVNSERFQRAARAAVRDALNAFDRMVK